MSRRRDTRHFNLGQAEKLTARRIAETAEHTDGEVLPGGGAVHPGNAVQFAQHTQTARGERAGVSRCTQIKLDALARLRPDLLEKVRQHRMSTHAAVLEAGIIKRPDALKQLLRWWGLATDDERRADILEAFHRLAAALICLRFVVRWLRPALASAPSAAV